MKTLDQIWEENFDTIAPGTYQGSDCGNQVGGGAEPNEKDPFNSLADKLKQVANDPALSNAAKEAKLQQILKDSKKPAQQGSGGQGPINNGPDPFYKLPSPGGGGGGGGGGGNTDPTSGPVTNPGVPTFENPTINLGGAIDIDIANDGSATVSLRGITPTTADAIKAALSAAMAAKNAACANNKGNQNGNGNPTTDPVTPTPTPTTPLVTPPTTPVAPVVPFRPITPPTTRPPGGVIGGRPVR